MDDCALFLPTIGAAPLLLGTPVLAVAPRPMAVATFTRIPVPYHALRGLPSTRVAGSQSDSVSPGLLTCTPPTRIQGKASWQVQRPQ
jgi:hypothetical protein